MPRTNLIFWSLASSAILAACSGAPTPEEVDASLKAATAAALPGSEAKSIEVINPERSAATWRWTAKIEDKAYACDADNRMRLPSCEAIT